MGGQNSKSRDSTTDRFLGAPFLACCDDRRCIALRDLLGTTAAEHRYLDPITQCLRQVTGCQMSIVMTIDETMGQVIAESGWPYGHLARPMSFCAWSLVPVFPEVLVIEDATKDARFRQNPAVTGAPYLRFYAGAPLLDDDGNRLGSLCCIDTVPKQFDAESCSFLCNFADIVVMNMQHKRQASNQSLGFGLVRIDLPNWPLVYSSDLFSDITNLKKDDTIWDTYCIPGNESSYDSRFSESVRGDVFRVNISKRSGNGKEVLALQFWPAWKSDKRRKIGFLSTDKPNPIIKKLYFVSVSQLKRHKSQLISSALTETIVGALGPNPIEGLQVDEAIARGSFGVVYKGHLHSDEVAVKVIPVREGFDPALEATLSSQIEHPNVVKTLDFAIGPDNSGWLVMQLCTGGALQKAIDAGMFRTNNSYFDGTVDLMRVYTVAKQIADGMCYLHHVGILHGDLNCNNILLDGEGNAKIADFGLSRAIVGDNVMTESLGTMTHMPVELLTEGISTTAMDVYSYGVILWEMLTSQRAWAGVRPSMIITHKMRGERLKWPEAIPDAVKELSDICMSDDMLDRPSFDEILRTLDINVIRLRRSSIALNMPDFPVYQPETTDYNPLH